MFLRFIDSSHIGFVKFFIWLKHLALNLAYYLTC